jgi:hypothetical protein
MANLRWSFAGSHMHLSEAGSGDRRRPANCRSMESGIGRRWFAILTRGPALPRL